jgi:putative oxidoreductase
MSDLGILVLRVVVGVVMAAHGAQKLFGWFGGYGLKGTGGFFEQIGFRPGVTFAAAASLSEFLGGLLLVLGLFTQLGAAAILGAMIVASISVHWKSGFFATNNGIELPFIYGLISLSLILIGAGAYSLDANLGINFLSRPAYGLGLIVLSVVTGAVTLVARRQGQLQPSAS